MQSTYKEYTFFFIFANCEPLMKYMSVIITYKGNDYSEKK